MKNWYFLLAMMSVSTTYAACILRNVVNNSPTSTIIVRSVVPVKGTKKSKGVQRGGSLIQPRMKGSSEPRTVNVNWSVGEYMRILVSEKTSLGEVCKKYRIFVNEEKERVFFQKKEGCQIGFLEYETLYELPMAKPCYVDLYLEGGVNTLNIQITNDKDGPTINPFKTGS